MNGGSPPERRPGPAVVGASRVGTYGRPDNFVPVFNVPRTLDDLWLTRLQDARPADIGDLRNRRPQIVAIVVPVVARQIRAVASPHVVGIGSRRCGL
jgi:hypothetical protein